MIQVTKAQVNIIEKPWEPVVIDGKVHSHGKVSNIFHIFEAGMASDNMLWLNVSSRSKNIGATNLGLPFFFLFRI